MTKTVGRLKDNNSNQTAFPPRPLLDEFFHNGLSDQNNWSYLTNLQRNGCAIASSKELCKLTGHLTSHLRNVFLMRILMKSWMRTHISVNFDVVKWKCDLFMLNFNKTIIFIFVFVDLIIRFCHNCVCNFLKGFSKSYLVLLLW